MWYGQQSTSYCDIQVQDQLSLIPHLVMPGWMLASLMRVAWGGGGLRGKGKAGSSHS